MSPEQGDGWPTPREAAAAELARSHALSEARPVAPPSLRAIPALLDWMEDAHTRLETPSREAAKASEWLLDNAYRLERAIRRVRMDLPKSFQRQLPALSLGKGEARIYAITQALVEATQLQLDSPTILRFLRAYQQVAALTLGELWALPTMLRLACIEVLVEALGRLAPGLEPPYELSTCPGPSLNLDETERVARAIRALAAVSSIPWEELVRDASRIEDELRRDPAQAYEAMDAETRDRYRRAVELLAQRSHHEEAEVARRAVAHARGAGRAGERPAHVGYWLIDEGLPAFERSLSYRPRLRARARRRLKRHASALYFLALSTATAALASLPVLYLWWLGVSPAVLAAGCALALLPASAVAVTGVQWLVSLVLPPRTLPKLDPQHISGTEHRTAVVIPTLLGSAAEVGELLAQLERHYLCNPDGPFLFALLTDHVDADTPETEADAALLEQVSGGIRQLNERYGGNTRGPFHLLHRRRLFNPAEDRWMGWERKRGKLEELNRYLAGNGNTSFVRHEGDADALRGVRFVITLDSDTVLPRGTAARLVGVLAHPLNRAELDPATGRVRAGYTVIQPRVEVSPDSGNRSLFARLFCGDTAIDIYSRAVSDLYQDLFESGVFIGKGIYEIGGFARSLEGRVPENAIVSHDLFEGLHGRAGLATDIALYEGYPASYIAFARRMHRWIRGDWQLLPWLWRRVPAADGGRVDTRFSAIDRWKIADNLRRSLVPPSLVTMLLAGWLALPGAGVVWTLLAVLAPGANVVLGFFAELARVRQRPAALGRIPDLRDPCGRWVLSLAFLPHEAALTLDAIARTLVRLAFTRRHLLEWTTAAHTEALTHGHPRMRAWVELCAGPLLAAATGAGLILWSPAALAAAAPLLFLWLASPEIALRISRPVRRDVQPLAKAQVPFVRRLARRTWLFFESFVGPSEHWLPPDNYQEDPLGEIAHRTSPTNIGMLLLATLSAWDLGYLGLPELRARIASTLRTLEQLERYRGHLLNWYDTRTLEPLSPQYVSSVDSGNLAACLITLRAAVDEVLAAPLLRSARWRGLDDALGLLDEAATGAAPERSDDSLAGVKAQIAKLRELTDEASARPGSALAALAQLESEGCPTLDKLVLEAVEAWRGRLGLDALRELRLWLARVHDQVRSMRSELDLLLPVLSALREASAERAGKPLAELSEALQEALVSGASPADLQSLCGRLRDGVGTQDTSPDLAERVDRSLADTVASLQELTESFGWIASRAEREVDDVDFRLLYDEERRLLHIGYNRSADRLDPHYYDLLASEARLASFIAIAKGEVPVKHWYALGRPVTRVDHAFALLSWGGTMFEYLMPPLLMRSHEGTLLEISQSAAVSAQMADATRRGTPWGVSESGYAATDADHVYQYRGFGVAGLGLKRGLEADAVVAPYASALALPVCPREACENLERLSALGGMGSYGMFEALDFASGGASGDFAIVRSYMSHHQGMALAAFANLLCDDAHVRRFQSDPRMRTAEILLHERTPRSLVFEQPHRSAAGAIRITSGAVPNPWQPTRAGAHPETHVLGNGRLTSLVTDSGSGGLLYRGRALSRFVPDTTLDDTGYWIYVFDREGDGAWSVTRQPTGAAAEDVEVTFQSRAVEFHRRDHGISLRTEIAVAAADDVEIRRVTITNETGSPRRLCLASAFEVVLASSEEDERHPVFSKLFVEAEALTSSSALLFRRRTRDPEERPPVLLHRLVADDPAIRLAGFETDRERFLGRLGRARAPAGLRGDPSDSQGAAFDPIASLRVELELPSFGEKQLAFVTAAAGSRDSVLELASRYDSLAAIDWALAETGREASREVERLDLDPEALPCYQQLASLVVHTHPGLWAAAEAIADNRLGQAQLWRFGISGDLPFALVSVSRPELGSALGSCIRAHQLWSGRGLSFDLVVLAEGSSSYQDDAGDAVRGELERLDALSALGRRGGVHLVRSEELAPGERGLLESAARVVVRDEGESLEQQLATAHVGIPRLPPFGPQASPHPDRSSPLRRRRDLVFDNGYGGFAPDGREYVVHLEAGQHTPAPWVNVLANPEFGSTVSEAGLGFSWYRNAGENRITPWSNDPVLDTPGEALYLRDEETARVWTPTPAPAGGDAACEIRHGAGYTVWRRHADSLEQELCVFVAPDAPVKIVRLRLRNVEDRPRRITATYLAEWLLGATRRHAAPHVVTSYDASSHAILARNAWNADHASAVAFLASDRSPHGYTTDRTEFLGREGDRARPAALERWGLSGARTPAADSCGALQVHVDLEPGGEQVTHFLLGQAQDETAARALVGAFRDPERVQDAWTRMHEQWESLLGAVQVETPDRAVDVLLNRWLMYQAVSCRLWARAGFYQAGGAFGFRDQLQDAMALVHAAPEQLREHILRCARHQFEEGDVLHWWHPPVDRGVRTRCSDDLLWLPFATAHYVEATGDDALLHEPVPFLQGAPLEAGEHDRYDAFPAGRTATLFEHCERAVERGVTRGARGLPLIGDGDWNDGLNRVGREGRGESVWLAWFAIATMRGFAALCERMDQKVLARAWRGRSQELLQAVEGAAWDGAWYLRAFDDEGRPWGSAELDECAIDSIAQSWSVLCGASDPERADAALRAAQEHLMRPQDQLVRLLWPPFDLTTREPGYIHAYPPGVRENGGHYAHAAAWLGFAFVARGDGERAAEVLRRIHPLSHSATREDARRYRLEPYVAAADIAGAEPHLGRGGWSWYTGAAAWSWRLGVEGILGLRREGGRVRVDPCLPPSWGGYRARVRGTAGELEIDVSDPERVGRGVVACSLDGQPLAEARVALPDDGQTHRLEVRLGRSAQPAADDNEGEGATGARA